AGAGGGAVRARAVARRRARLRRRRRGARGVRRPAGRAPRRPRRLAARGQGGDRGTGRRGCAAADPRTGHAVLGGAVMHPFEYAVLRVVPRIERGECLNAGVVLYSRPLDYLGARVHLDVQRLHALDPTADAERIAAALEAVRAHCAQERVEARHASPAGRRRSWSTCPRPWSCRCASRVGRAMDDAVAPGPLTDWLRREVPQVAVGDGPVAVEPISGGHSNLTYRLTDAVGRRFALRR